MKREELLKLVEIRAGLVVVGKVKDSGEFIRRWAIEVHLPLMDAYCTVQSEKFYIGTQVGTDELTLSVEPQNFAWLNSEPYFELVKPGSELYDTWYSDNINYYDAAIEMLLTIPRRRLSDSWSVEQIMGSEYTYGNSYIKLLEDIGVFTKIKDAIKPATVAADWWVDALNKPKFDNGATDRGNVMASIMAMMLAERANSDDKQKERLKVFRESFIRTISCSLPYAEEVRLSVDYNPSKTLYELATIADLDTMTFPWKTNMYISMDEICVACGYTAPTETIFMTRELYENRIAYYNTQIDIVRDEENITSEERIKKLTELGEELHKLNTDAMKLLK